MKQSPAFTINHHKSKLSEIGKRVKDARQAKGMKQTELAELIGISSKTISAIEVGRVEPSISQMLALSSALEEPLGYFVGETVGSVESKMDRIKEELESIRELMALTEAKKAVRSRS